MKVFQSLGLAGALAATLAFGGCSSTQTWPMAAAARVPAAEGKVQVAAEKNGNHDVKVEVQHLAPPDKVADGAAAYVVWIKPEQGAPQNVGVLKVDENLQGNLETKTDYRTFEVMVTAERDANATAPTGTPVMRTNVTAPG
jgi:hypothetical protein